MKASLKSPWLRRSVQIFFFLWIALTSFNHTLMESGRGIPFLSSASIHSLCPFGGVVSLYQFMTVGTLVQKVHESAFVLLLITLFLALLAGPVLCSWVCPLGSIQEWVGRIGKKIWKRRYNHWIPMRLDKVLRYLRYGVLGWVVYMTAFTGKLVFDNVDPYSALFHLWSSEIAVGGLIVLGVTLMASLFVERPWCKYACPYGAVLGLSNLFRIFTIKRNAAACISCDTCDRSCPMNIKVSAHGTVRDHQCISCLECTSEASCPILDTVELSCGIKKMDGPAVRREEI